MPGDRVDDWEIPPPTPAHGESRGGRTRATLAALLERGWRTAVGPSLLAASVMLVAGQLFTAYRTLRPAPGEDQMAYLPDDLSSRVGFLLSYSDVAAPVLLACLPLLVLAGLAHLPGSGGPPVLPALRRAAGVTAFALSFVGVVILVVTALWTVVTRGKVTNPTDGSVQIMVDPVATFLTGGSRGLATLVLAGVAASLLWPRSSAPVAPVAPVVPGTQVVPGAHVAQGAETGPSAPVPDSSATPATASPPLLATASPAAVPPPVADPEPVSSEPVMPGGDPAVFRRPDASVRPTPVAAAAHVEDPEPDPVNLFQRPRR